MHLTLLLCDRKGGCYDTTFMIKMNNIQSSFHNRKKIKIEWFQSHLHGNNDYFDNEQNDQVRL